MPSKHDDLASDYIQELNEAKVLVMEWWDEMHQNPPADIDAKDVETSIKRRWPAGPCSHPRIIAIFRKYFIATEELNDRLETDQEVETGSFRDNEQWEDEAEDDTEEGFIPPRALLLEQLKSRAPDLAEFMKRFVYMPMGVDPDGNNC